MTEQQQLTVQGQRVDSIPEFIMAEALERLEIPFIYQYEVFGGKNVRGGQVIDFLLLIPPRSIPLFVNGRYWHEGKNAREEELKIAELSSKMRGEFAEPVIIWTDEYTDIDGAVAILRARIL